MTDEETVPGPGQAGSLAAARHREALLDSASDSTMHDAEASLRESEGRYRRLIEHSPDIVYVFSDKRGGIFYSPRVQSVLGYTEAHMYEHPFLWNESIHPDDLPAVAAAVREFALGRPFAMEYRVQRANGDWVWLFDRSISRIEADGEVLVEGLATDVTDRKAMEADLREAQRLEGLGRVAGGIAHDFNNVLVAVLGNAALAKDHLQLFEISGAIECLGEIEHAGEFARDLLQQILAYCRRQPPTLLPQSLFDVVDNALKLVRMTVPAHVDLRVSRGSADLVAAVDATQMGQVLLNLCTNAWHALEGGHGQIAIDTCACPDGHARCARLRVADRGRGMDEETRARLFEPFFTTKPMGRGTGIGMAVVRNIVTAHGGSVCVDSAPGQGTRIDIHLPLHAMDEPTDVKGL